MPTYANIGCFGHCDPINTGVLAPAEGVYIISTTFNGQIVRVPTDSILSGEPIVFEASELNESYQYQGYIIDDTGAVVPASYISFEIKVNI